MLFQKQDLEANHYHWKDEQKVFLVGEPSRRTFDKFNGNQVLFMINFYGSLSDKFTLSEGKELERSILFDLPDYAKSEISVFNWIRNSERN
jgi:hypothetical protein